MKTMEFCSGSMLHGFQGNPWNFPHAFSMVFSWFSHVFSTRVLCDYGGCIPCAIMEAVFPVRLWRLYLLLRLLRLYLLCNYGSCISCAIIVAVSISANNVIVVCKKYYIDTLVKELGINNINSNNPTYIPIDDSFETIIKGHNQFITLVGLEMSEEDQNLPYLYWTSKLHKSPYKHRFIAGSSKCTTKDLSCLLTKLLSTIKDGLVRYCNTKTSRNGVNNMWILKNSRSLLSSLDQLDVRTAKSVQTFDFSMLYTSIPHDLLKSRISNLVHNAFRKKDGSVRYTHIKLTRAKGYFTHDINGGGDNMFTADSICEMIEF